MARTDQHARRYRGGYRPDAGQGVHGSKPALGCRVHNYGCNDNFRCGFSAVSLGEYISLANQAPLPRGFNCGGAPCFDCGGVPNVLRRFIVRRSEASFGGGERVFTQHATPAHGATTFKYRYDEFGSGFTRLDGDAWQRVRFSVDDCGDGGSTRWLARHVQRGGGACGSERRFDDSGDDDAGSVFGGGDSPGDVGAGSGVLWSVRAPTPSSSGAVGTA